MNRKELFKYIYYVILFIVTAVLILLPVNNKTDAHLYENKILKAKITKQLEVTEEGDSTFSVKNYKFLAVVTGGEFDGKVIEIEDNVDSNMTFYIPAEVGDDVLIYPEMNLDKTEITKAYISNFRRDKWILFLIILFVVLILLVGRIKGIKSILSLALTLLLVIKVFLPRVIIGYNPIILSMFIATWITIVTISLVSGVNKKSVAAILGTIAGVLFGALIAIFISYEAKIIGFTMSQAQQLTYLPQGTKFDFNGLLFATILLGALGAVMDVAMSIASSIFELRSHNEHISIKKLYNSGMNIGRDVMGTMINTLILAYVGSSIHILMIILSYNIEFYNVINNDVIVTELIRAFAGTSGLIVAIPLTSILAAVLCHKKIEISKD